MKAKNVSQIEEVTEITDENSVLIGQDTSLKRIGFSKLKAQLRNILGVDTAPVKDSVNFITSGAVEKEISNIKDGTTQANTALYDKLDNSLINKPTSKTYKVQTFGAGTLLRITDNFYNVSQIDIVRIYLLAFNSTNANATDVYLVRYYGTGTNVRTNVYRVSGTTDYKFYTNKTAGINCGIWVDCANSVTRYSIIIPLTSFDVFTYSVEIEDTLTVDDLQTCFTTSRMDILGSATSATNDSEGNSIVESFHKLARRTKFYTASSSDVWYKLTAPKHQLNFDLIVSGYQMYHYDYVTKLSTVGGINNGTTYGLDDFYISLDSFDSANTVLLKVKGARNIVLQDNNDYNENNITVTKLTEVEYTSLVESGNFTKLTSKDAIKEISDIKNGTTIVAKATADENGNNIANNIEKAQNFDKSFICSTASDTAEKTLLIPGFTLDTGVTIKTFFPNGNTADTPTLNINNLGAKSIKIYKDGEKINAVSNWLSGINLDLMFDGEDFILLNNPFIDSEPTGIIKAFAGETEPYGYLICDGRALSRSTYQSLFSVIGTLYGDGDGTTTFNIPDLRECVPVGAGQNTTASIASHDVYELGQFKDDQLQGHSHRIGGSNDTQGTNTINNRDSMTYAGGDSERKFIKGFMSDDINGTPRVGTTTHGKQLGVNYIIKC